MGSSTSVEVARTLLATALLARSLCGVLALTLEACCAARRDASSAWCVTRSGWRGTAAARHADTGLP